VIKVVLADDEDLVRSGLRMILGSAGDIEVVAECDDGLQVAELVRLHRPHVVLLDIRMRATDGLAALRRLLALPEPPAVAMLTTFDVDDYVYEALRIGASGFLLKDAPVGDLIQAVRVVAAGDALLAPSVTRRLIADFARNRPAPRAGSAPRLSDLTPRETEVLGLIARGLSNTEIAADLVVAEQTVKTHIGRILAKLRLRDRAQAVIFAYESRLVAPGDLAEPRRDLRAPGPSGP
jgi:DNA-binding NarL/FixJ family response regulator